MKKLIVYLAITLIIILSVVLASCTTIGTSTSNPVSTSPNAPVPISTMTEQTHWWDIFGEPEYGDTFNMIGGETASWDPAEAMNSGSMLHFEHLFGLDWTVDPKEWKTVSSYVPDEYIVGSLAEKWEQKDDLTVIVYLKKGIHFWDKAPVNGRELVAGDVEYSYNRLMGTGSGFTKPNPFWAPSFTAIEKVTAKDPYTVEFKLKKPGVLAIRQILSASVMFGMCIVPREWVEQGDTQNWQKAVGTGPWVVTDYRAGSNITFEKYPNYWGYDERHPKNRLPYFDKFENIYIPDMATALSALRTGKIDIIAADRRGITLSQADAVAKSNPELVQGNWPGNGATFELRCDLEPFSNHNVRKALQLAVDSQAIAKSIYLGKVDGKPAGQIQPHLNGWTLPYDEWPKELQQEYTYNPTKAKELLAEAGYHNGFKTSVIIETGPDVEIGEIFKAFFHDIGVEMDIITMEPAALRSFVSAFKHEGMYMTARSAMPMAPDFVLQFRMSKSTNNATRNNDANYDSLVEQMYSATTLEKAKQLATEADMYILSHHWAITACPGIIPIIWQPYLKGYNGEFSHIHDWNAFLPTRLWIDQDKKKTLR